MQTARVPQRLCAGKRNGISAEEECARKDWRARNLLSMRFPQALLFRYYDRRSRIPARQHNTNAAVEMLHEFESVGMCVMQMFTQYLCACRGGAQHSSQQIRCQRRALWYSQRPQHVYLTLSQVIRGAMESLSRLLIFMSPAWKRVFCPSQTTCDAIPYNIDCNNNDHRLLRNAPVTHVLCASGLIAC
jgi:hypothetical protein